MRGRKGDRHDAVECSGHLAAAPAAHNEEPGTTDARLHHLAEEGASVLVFLSGKIASVGVVQAPGHRIDGAGHQGVTILVERPDRFHLLGDVLGLTQASMQLLLALAYVGVAQAAEHLVGLGK
jgi:hypothetical protein